MATKKISELTAISTIADTDVLPIVDISENETKKISYSQLTGGATPTEIGYLTGLTSNAQAQFDSKAMDMYVKTGWYPIINTATYVSWDATVSTGVIKFTGNVTGILSAGMKLKLTQTTIKFAIVTAVGTYSGGVTPVTLYFGTDYTLANATIADVYFSTQKQPFAFPSNPDKWTITSQIDNSAAVLSGNIASLGNIKVAIGAWNFITYGFAFWIATANTSYDFKFGFVQNTTYSPDGNNSVNGFFPLAKTEDNGYFRGNSAVTTPNINLSNATTFYANMAISPSTNFTAVVNLSFKAVCAYL